MCTPLKVVESEFKLRFIRSPVYSCRMFTSANPFTGWSVCFHVSVCQPIEGIALAFDTSSVHSCFFFITNLDASIVFIFFLFGCAPSFRNVPRVTRA